MNYSRLNIIRQALKLNQPIWQDLPDELLEIAFRPSGVVTKKNQKKLLIEKYGFYNLEPLEFLGDAVIELVATQIVWENFYGTPGQMTETRSDLVRNTTLYCLMNKLNLCDLIEGKKKYSLKDCADIFEALIGVLYFYLYFIKQTNEYMDILQNYISTELFDARIMTDLQNGIAPDNCIIESGQRAYQVGKTHVVAKKSINRADFLYTIQSQIDRSGAITSLPQQTIFALKDPASTPSLKIIYDRYHKGDLAPQTALKMIYDYLGIKDYNVQLLTPETNYPNKEFVVGTKTLDLNNQLITISHLVMSKDEIDATNRSNEKTLNVLFNQLIPQKKPKPTPKFVPYSPSPNQTPSSNKSPFSNQTPSSNKSPFSNQPPSSNKSPFSNQTPSSNKSPFSNQPPSSNKSPFSNQTQSSNKSPFSNQSPASNKSPFSNQPPSSNKNPFSD
jgi:hypothetical protein